MNEHDIKKATRPNYLPEPHRTILDAALSGLIQSDTDMTIKVSKTKRSDGGYTFAVDVQKD